MLPVRITTLIVSEAAAAMCTVQEWALSIKTALAQLLNTAVLPLIANANIQSFSRFFHGALFHKRVHLPASPTGTRSSTHALATCSYMWVDLHIILMAASICVQGLPGFQ